MHTKIEVTEAPAVHTTPEEFQSRGFTLKTHQIFSVHRARRNHENATIIGYFGFVLELNSVREITYIGSCLIFLAVMVVIGS